MWHNLAVTLCCLAAPVLSMVVVGLPLRGLLSRGRALGESAWIQVPFVGLSFTLFVLQLLVRVDVPVRVGVLVLAGAVGALWAFWLWRGQWRESLRNWPKGAFTVAAGVLVIHSAGLLIAGSKVYAGRAFSDHAGYTVMAEFFRDQGFTLAQDNVSQEPWLVLVKFLKEFRIGQSVLQAYHAVLTGQDTRNLFMPTILLCGPLVALALFAAARVLGLGVVPACLAAAFGGLMPAVTVLELECFQSHALAIPSLVLAPTILALYNRRRRFAEFAVAGMCCGSLASIYTEFLPLMIAIVGFFFLHACALRPRRFWHLSSFVGLLLAPVLYCPLGVGGICNVLRCGVDARFVLAHLFPWSYQGGSLVAVWVGDMPLCSHPATIAVALRGLATWEGAAMTLGSTVGLLMLCWQSLRRNALQGAWGLPLAMAGLTALPGLMFVRDHEHPYQFFKVLVTVCPFMALGLTAGSFFLVQRLQTWLAPRPSLCRLATISIWGFVLFGAITAACGSLLCAAFSGNSMPNYRSAQHESINPHFQALRRYLTKMEGQSILYRAPPSYFQYQRLWIAYFGRHNQLWTAEYMNDDGINPPNTSVEISFVSWRTLPRDFLVLSCPHSLFLRPPGDLPKSNVLWQSPQYVMWKPPAAPWVGLTDVQSVVSVQTDTNSIFVGNDGTLVRFFASDAGWAKLRLEVALDPRVPTNKDAAILVKDPHGSEERRSIAGAPLQFTFAVQRGLNDLRFELQGLSRPLVAQEGLRLAVQDLVWEPSPGTAGETHPNASQ
jgi:hypothetical protein